MRPTAESALAKIRRQRKGEAKATEQYEVRDENAEIYQTVTEEDYQKLKETRRAQNWVEGEGYSDDGEEWWESDSGGDFADDDSLDDERDEETASRRDTAAGTKRKKSALERRGKKGASAAAGGGKRARKAGQGGGAAGEVQQQQQQSLRMRSLVQHFTARAAETAALQQQQRLTQRDAESLRSIDKLLEEEEEAEGLPETAEGVAPGCVGRRLSGSSSLSAHAAGPTQVDRPYPGSTVGRAGAAGKSPHTGLPVAAAARGDVSARLAAHSQDYLDRADAGLEPTQTLGGDGGSGFSDLGNASSRCYNVHATSFLEQLGLGNSCAVSCDRPFAGGRAGELAAAQAHQSTALLTCQSSSHHPYVAPTGSAAAGAQRPQGGAPERSSSRASDGKEVSNEKRQQSERRDETATGGVDSIAGRDSEEPPEDAEETIAAATDELQEGRDSLFKSTGEFAQHKTGGGLALVKHAQPDFFLWAEDEDEQEPAPTPGTLAAGSTGELKSAAAAATAPAVAGLSSSPAGKEALLKKRSSAGGQTEKTPEGAKIAGEADKCSGMRAAGGLPCCKDGTLPFYILDVWEEDGLLFLFGKVWVAAAEAADGAASACSWNRGGRMRVRAPESCCVVVRDMMVPLFFRTREQVSFHAEPPGVVDSPATGGDRSVGAAVEGQKEDGAELVQVLHSCGLTGEDGGSGSSAAPQDEHGEEEVLRRRLKHRLDITRAFFMQDAQRLKKKYQWRKVAIKGVFRHYAFDAPGVPRDRDQTFVKMYVPAAASGPLLQPEDWEGETYTHVFGTRASLVELLLVKRHIKGPCWLRIRDFSCVDSPLDRLSWCKHEVVVHSHKAVCCWDYKLQTLAPTTPPKNTPASPPSALATASGAGGAVGGTAAASTGADGGGACAADSDAAAGDGAASAVQILPPPHPPPLTVVSVCLKTFQVPSCGLSSSPSPPAGARGGATTGERQLAIASFFVYRNADIDDQAAAAPRLTPQTAFCAVRRVRLPRVPASSAPDTAAAVQPAARVLAEGVPLRFSEACAQQGFTLFDSERSLLLTFVNQIAAADPDILLGHDVYSCTLDFLAQRLAMYGLPVWHRLSRLKRGKQQQRLLRSSSPNNGLKGASAGAPAGGLGFLWGGRVLTVGRLVCDTYLQSRELLPHRVDYDLFNLLQSLFFPHGLPSATAAGGAAKGDQQRLEAAVKGLRMFPQQHELLQCFQRREPQPLLACMHLTLQEAYVTLLLCWRLNCLPLTRELTTIGGNLWNRSLQNQRAERNAFLLLHEFHREKYVCPDPPLPANAAAAANRRQLRRRGAVAGEASGGATAQQARHHTGTKKEQASRGRQRCPGSREEAVDPDAAAEQAAEGMADDEAFEDCEDAPLADAAALQEEEEAVGGSAAVGDGHGAVEGTGGGAAGASASYTGGLVLEPRVGYYETFVLLLDFNSLYPSIIQEFNICFSTVKRAAVGKGECAASYSKDGTCEGAAAALGRTSEGAAEVEGGQSIAAAREADDACTNSDARGVQGVSSTPGVLPRILRQLVQRRRAVKASMKAESNAIRRAALDVKQLALKLTANSIYGCLGFSHSRFYARDLAAFITQQGRSVLLATKEKVERVLRLEVLYGDTDSLMINTGLHDDGGVGKAYAQAVRLGEQVKAEINRNYRRLEIDLEAVFRRLLLLRKKKYACCIVVDYAKQRYRLEQKGLDFVRRDWAKLTRVVGQQLLEILFAAGPSKRRATLPSSPAGGGAVGQQCEESEKPLQNGEQQLQGPHEPEETVDAVVEKLHANLEEVARQLRDKKVPLEYFVITKALTKLPHMYPRGAGGAVVHPHVQVALRMQSKGFPIKPGSEIPFVICTAESARAVLYPSENAACSNTSEAGGGVAADKPSSSPVDSRTNRDCNASDSSSNLDNRSSGGSSSDRTGARDSRVASGNKSARATESGGTSSLAARSEKTGSPSGSDIKTSTPEKDSKTLKMGAASHPPGAANTEKGPALSASERAFHPREVLNNPLLEVDVEYYLEQQLLPPVLRLCAHVQGTSAARLAQCLGLDGSKHARGRGGGYSKRADSDDEDGSCSREAREQAGEEQILALLARTDEKYRHHPLPIHLRCESCRVQIAGKDVLRFMRCPRCLWWISPSTLSNFIIFTLAALQRRFTQAIMRCNTCEERYAGLPTPAAAVARGLPSAGAPWQQQQEQQARAAAASGWVRCPRCEEGRLREEMSSHDMYVYLDQLLFYLSGDVTAQQRLLAEKCAADEPEKVELVWKHFYSSSGLGRPGAPLNGSSPQRGDDAWLVPAGLDANLRVRVLSEEKGKLPPSGLARQGALASAYERGQDLLEDLYGRVTQQEVNVKRGAQLRYPGLTAAVTYWQKSKRGLGWIDMQRERDKLRATVNEVMEQNAYRMLKLSSLYSVMRPPALLDPTKRRWRIVEKLNLLKQTEAARVGWNEELRCRAPALMACLQAVAQAAHAGD